MNCDHLTKTRVKNTPTDRRRLSNKKTEICPSEKNYLTITLNILRRLDERQISKYLSQKKTSNSLQYGFAAIDNRKKLYRNIFGRAEKKTCCIWKTFRLFQIFKESYRHWEVVQVFT